MIKRNASSRKPRLLVLTSTYPRWPGDAEPGFVHELTRRLADDFDLLVLGPHAAGARVDEVIDGVRIHRYRYAPASLETLINHGGMLTNLRRSPWKWLLLPAFLLAQAWAIARALRQFKPDVVHAHWLIPQGLLAAWIKSVPVIVTSHGADLFGLQGRLFAALRRWVTGRAAAITVVSAAMRQRLQDEVPQAVVAVMPMGVDVSHGFYPDATVRRAHQLLFVGRLVEKKGLLHLIEALPTVLAQCPQTTLNLIGFGPEEAYLRKRVSALGLDQHVAFLGALPQPQLAAHYRQATLFVAPFVQARGGDQEGLGLVVAEAMACGCPVLVGDVPGVRDLVTETTGVRVDPANHAALAGAIVALLNDPALRLRYAVAGRDYVCQHFGWDAVARGYSALLLAWANKASTPEKKAIPSRPLPGKQGEQQSNARPLKIWLPALRVGSGAEVFVQRLAQGLRDAGHDPVVQWFDRRYELMPWRLMSIAPPAGTDVVHAGSWHGFAFKRPGIPLVVTEHQYVRHPAFLPHTSIAQRLYHRLFVDRCVARSYRAADAIVAVSEHVAAQMRSDLGRRVEMIHNAVDTGHFTPAISSTSTPVMPAHAGTQRLAMDDKPGRRITGRAADAARPFKLLFVGNPSRWKGADVLAPLAEMLGPAFEIQCLFGLRGAGFADQHARLRMLAPVSPEHMPAVYHPCDAVLVPTRYEAFGYVALEAMACGKAVVGFASTGTAEVCVHGQTALLAPMDDLQTLAAHVRRLAIKPDLCARLGSGGRQRAVNVFSQRRAVLDHVALYRRLLGVAPSRRRPSRSFDMNL